MFREPHTTERRVDNFLQFTWNPGCVGKGSPCRSVVELHLVVLTPLLVCRELRAIGGHLRACRKLLPICRRACPHCQSIIDGDALREFEQAPVQVGDLGRRLDVFDGVTKKPPDTTAASVPAGSWSFSVPRGALEPSKQREVVAGIGGHLRASPFPRSPNEAIRP